MSSHVRVCAANRRLSSLGVTQRLNDMHSASFATPTRWPCGGFACPELGHHVLFGDYEPPAGRFRGQHATADGGPSGIRHRVVKTGSKTGACRPGGDYPTDYCLLLWRSGSSETIVWEGASCGPDTNCRTVHLFRRP